MLVNLTPHPVRLYGEASLEHGPIEVIPPSGKVARLNTDIAVGMKISPNSGVGYELVKYGDTDGLPPPERGTDYIVSLVVALAVRDRDDLLAPYLEVRNAEGTMVGCRYLQKVC